MLQSKLEIIRFKLKIVRSAMALCEIWLHRDHFLTIRSEQWAERVALEWEMEHAKCS